MVNPMKNNDIDKLHHAYDKAWHAMVKKRDEVYTPGTIVKSRINPEFTVKVIEGSLYADQVNTTYGHMSWRYLDKTEQSNVGSADE